MISCDTCPSLQLTVIDVISLSFALFFFFWFCFGLFSFVFRCFFRALLAPDICHPWFDCYIFSLSAALVCDLFVCSFSYLE